MNFSNVTSYMLEVHHQ